MTAVAAFFSPLAAMKTNVDSTPPGGRKTDGAPKTKFSSAHASDNSKRHQIQRIDPSYKSKRYRDKLRTEIKALENLLPVDRHAVHRKLDSQTVFRLSIGYFRTKLFLQAAGLASNCSDVKIRTRSGDQTISGTNTKSSDSSVTSQVYMTNWENTESMLQALDGFMLALTSDGTILYVSDNILQHLGFNQIDLIMRCIYGIVHPDDHQELKVILEQTLSMHFADTCPQYRVCCATERGIDGAAPCRTLSFLCRMKCFNGTTTGYLKMQCVGHMRSFPHVTKSQRTSNNVLFALCRPFLSLSTDPSNTARCSGFWTKHELDLKFKQMEPKLTSALGYEASELEMTSFYLIIHPEDLLVVRNCHSALIQSDEIQTMYFRVQHKDGSWIWLHTRGKVVFKNSKKYSIIFTHCPVKEVDSTYIQQEALLRQRYAIPEMMYGQVGSESTQQVAPLCESVRSDIGTSFLHDSHGQCPSSWHTAADRHSPVFPQHHLPHQPHHGNRTPSYRDVSTASWPSQKPDLRAAYASLAPPPPLALSDMSGCGSRVDPEEVDGVSVGVPRRRQYFMQLNGATPQYSNSEAFLIQGHVTTWEGDGRPVIGGTDACAYAPMSAIGQPVGCAAADCAYGPLNCYQSGAVDTMDNRRAAPNYNQSLLDSGNAYGQPIKQENGLPTVSSQRQDDALMTSYDGWHVQKYSHLVSASDVTGYTYNDVMDDVQTHNFGYA